MPALPAGRIAVISDIHGNADALRAVLDDIASRDVAAIFNLGDVFSGPLAAAETWDILRPLNLPTLRGNHDRALIETPPDRMGRWEAPAYPQLPPEALDWLRSLPFALDFEDAFLCHACPDDDVTPWTDMIVEHRVRPASADRLEAMAAHNAEPLLLCGHTHIPHSLRLSGGRQLVNPGSVGCPAFADRRRDPPSFGESGSPDARYALLDRAGSGWRVALISVPYDASRMIALAERRGEPDWAAALATGRIEG